MFRYAFEFGYLVSTLSVALSTWLAVRRLRRTGNEVRRRTDVVRGVRRSPPSRRRLARAMATSKARQST
jgi:hypothetical protein